MRTGFYNKFLPNNSPFNYFLGFPALECLQIFILTQFTPEKCQKNAENEISSKILITSMLWIAFLKIFNSIMLFNTALPKYY